MTCKSSDSVHLAICSKCNEEYIGETREGKTRVPKRVQVYQQQIRQPQYQQLKCDEHFRTCGYGRFKVFPFFKLHSNNKCLKTLRNCNWKLFLCLAQNKAKTQPAFWTWLWHIINQISLVYQTNYLNIEK